MELKHDVSVGDTISELILIEPVGIETWCFGWWYYFGTYFNRTSWNWNIGVFYDFVKTDQILIEPVGIETLMSLLQNLMMKILIEPVGIETMYGKR